MGPEQLARNNGAVRCPRCVLDGGDAPGFPEARLRAAAGPGAMEAYCRGQQRILERLLLQVG
jgi:hypothetical protein